MIEKESARAGVGTPKRAEESTAACGATPDSVTEYSTGSESRQGRVERYLREHGHVGQEHALSREELVEALGYQTVRKFRLDVAEERRNGGLILSTTRGRGGYFIPGADEQGRQELSEFVQSCHNRAVNVFRIAKAARRALDVIDGQLRIGGGGECGTP